MFQKTAEILAVCLFSFLASGGILVSVAQTTANPKNSLANFHSESKDVLVSKSGIIIFTQSKESQIIGALISDDITNHFSVFLSPSDKVLTYKSDKGIKYAYNANSSKKCVSLFGSASIKASNYEYGIIKIKNDTEAIIIFSGERLSHCNLVTNNDEYIKIQFHSFDNRNDRRDHFLIIDLKSRSVTSNHIEKDMN